MQVISELETEDSGEYTCRIMIRSTDEINVTHTLSVGQARTQVLTDPKDGKINSTEGDSVQMSCQVEEDQQVDFVWTREGVRSA